MSLHQSDLPAPHPSADAVRRQLDRILRSPLFHRAPALSRLLKHLVERTLENGSDALKEYALGIDVFGRGESFDPTTDTIVRVQARRLRAKLDEFYRSRTDEPVRIEIPTGRYAPLFRTLASHHPGAPSVLGVTRGFGVALPAARTPLIGRDPELRALTRLLVISWTNERSRHEHGPPTTGGAVGAGNLTALPGASNRATVAPYSLRGGVSRSGPRLSLICPRDSGRHRA